MKIFIWSIVPKTKLRTLINSLKKWMPFFPVRLKFVLRHCFSREKKQQNDDKTVQFPFVVNLEKTMDTVPCKVSEKSALLEQLKKKQNTTTAAKKKIHF